MFDSSRNQACVSLACVQTSPISFAFPREAKEIGDVCTQASVSQKTRKLLRPENCPVKARESTSFFP